MPQPFLRLTMGVHQEDYEHLGYKLNQPDTCTLISAMADTGCQSCLAEHKVIRKVGLSQKDLIPVTTKMHTADQKDINILGAAIVRFSGKASNSKEASTRQMVYITDSTDKLFLSREACIDLGIITRSFPKISTNDNTLTSTRTPNHDQCNCPERSNPPPLPTNYPSRQPKPTEIN
jgi:hypothetical protein